MKASIWLLFLALLELAMFTTNGNEFYEFDDYTAFGAVVRGCLLSLFDVMANGKCICI